MELAKLNILAAAIDEAHAANDAAIRGAETAESINRKFPQDALKRLASAARESGQLAKSKGSELLEVMSQLATDIDADDDASTQRVQTLLEQTLEAAGIACQDGLWATQMAEAAVEDPKFPKIRLSESQRAKISNIQSSEDRVAKEAAEYERLLAACWERHDGTPPRPPAPKKSDVKRARTPWIPSNDPLPEVPSQADQSMNENETPRTINQSAFNSLKVVADEHTPMEDKAQIGNENKPRASEVQNTSPKGLYESFFFLKSRNPTNSTQSIMSMVPKKAHDVSSERNLEVASLKSAVASSSDSGNPAVVHNKASILKCQEFVCPVMTFVSLVMDKTISPSAATETIEVEVQETPILQNPRSQSPVQDNATNARTSQRPVIFWKALQEKSDDIQFSKFYKARKRLQKTRALKNKNVQFFVDTEPVEQQVEGEPSSKLDMDSNIVTTMPNVPKSTASDNGSHSGTAGNGPSSSSQGIICTSAASTLHLAPKASPRTSILKNVGSRGTTTNSNEEPEMAPNPLPRKTVSILKNVGSRGTTTNSNEEPEMAPNPLPRKTVSILKNVGSRGTTTNSNEEPEMAPNPLPRKTVSILKNVGSRGTTTNSNEEPEMAPNPLPRKTVSILKNVGSRGTTTNSNEEPEMAPNPLPRKTVSILKNVGSRGTTTNSNEEPEMAPNPLPRKTVSILKNVGSRGTTTNSNEEPEMAKPPRPLKRVHFSPDVGEEIILEETEEIPANQPRGSWYNRIKKFIFGRSTSTRTRGPRNSNS